MKCADCKNILRHNQASQAMYTTKTGFCGCAKQPAYVYFSRMRERECGNYQVKGKNE